MDLDDLKQVWAAHGAALERSLAINERLLREMMLRKARIALVPYLVWRAIEAALGVAAIGLIAPIVWAHLGEPRYVVAGGALLVFAIAITALTLRLVVGGLTIDHAAPVTALQREAEQLRRAGYRATKWAVLGGVLVWLPAALIGFEALTGIDLLARVDLAWLAGNLALGAVALVAGHAWSVRNVERADLGPRARRIVDAVSGHSLRAVAAHLAELAAFQRDEPIAR